MKKVIVSLSLLVSVVTVKAQIGIGTTTPQASLDIVASLPANPSNTDGLLIPRIDTFPSTSPDANQQGMLVYLTTAVGSDLPGFYYWDNVVPAWVSMKTKSLSSIHDTDIDTRIWTEKNTDEDRIRFDVKGGQKMIINDVGNVGIGTEPNANGRLHVNVGGNSSLGFLVTGYPSSNGAVPDLGYGTRMMFFPGKAAFRAGAASSVGWNDANVGRYSVAMGWQPEATEYGTVALGNLARARGFKSTAIGDALYAEGDYSLALGRRNRAQSFAECVVGQSATSYTPNSATAWDPNDRIFTVGNGQFGPSDALVILKNGLIGIGGESTPDADLHIKQSDLNPNGTGGLMLESQSSYENWKFYHNGAHLGIAQNGIARAYIQSGTGAWITTSDRHKKKNILKIKDVLGKVNQLTPVKYHYTDQNDSDKKISGFIAQEVATLFPDMVHYKGKKVLGLNYSEFGVLAIAALQEQQLEIELLKKINQQLMQRLKIIEAKLIEE